MTGSFDRGGAEQRAISEAVLDLDSRHVIDADRQASEQAEERQHYLAESKRLWDELRIAEDMGEMQRTMGSFWHESLDYPLVRISSGLMSYSSAPRPVAMGAHRVECSRTFEDVSSDIVALHGEVLFYRTIKELGGSRDKEGKEQYKDNGFFCFVLHTKNENGLTVPRLVFGDIDAASWPREPLKSYFVHRYLKKQIESIFNPTSLERTMAAADQFFGAGHVADLMRREEKRRLLRKDVILSGIFRQNQTSLIEGDDSTTRSFVRDKMQQFILAYIDPKKTIPSVTTAAQQLAENGLFTHEITNGMAVTEFDIAKAALTQGAVNNLDMREATLSEEILPPRYDKKRYGHREEHELWQTALAQEADFPFLDAVYRYANCPFYNDDIEYLIVDALRGYQGAGLRERLSQTTFTDEDMQKIEDKREKDDQRRVAIMKRIFESGYFRRLS